MFISIPAQALDRPDTSGGAQAILASLDQTHVTALNDEVDAGRVRGGDGVNFSTAYVLVKILGINTWDYGSGVDWTWNPLGYRYGYWGGPGWTNGGARYSDAGTAPTADTMDAFFMAHDNVYNNDAGNPAALLAADLTLFEDLSALPTSNGGYWGHVYAARPGLDIQSNRPIPVVRVSGISLIGGRFFFGWRDMPYSEYSRREALAGIGALIFGKSLISYIQLQ